MGLEKSHARVLIVLHWSRRQGAAVTSHLWSRTSRQQRAGKTFKLWRRQQGARESRDRCGTQRQWVDRRLIMPRSITRRLVGLSFATYAKGPAQHAHRP